MQKGLIGAIFVGGVSCNLRSRRSDRALKGGLLVGLDDDMPCEKPWEKVCGRERDNRGNRGDGGQ